MDVIKQHFGALALKFDYDGKILVLGAFFANVFFPEGLTKTKKTNYKKSPQIWIVSVIL